MGVIRALPAYTTFGFFGMVVPFTSTSRASWDALSCTPAGLPSDTLPRPPSNVEEHRRVVAIPASCALLLAVQRRYRHRPGRAISSQTRGVASRSDLHLSARCRP